MKRLDRNSFHWPDTPDELQKVPLKEMHWLCDGLSFNPKIYHISVFCLMEFGESGSRMRLIKR